MLYISFNENVQTDHQNIEKEHDSMVGVKNAQK